MIKPSTGMHYTDATWHLTPAIVNVTKFLGEKNQKNNNESEKCPVLSLSMNIMPCHTDIVHEHYALPY